MMYSMSVVKGMNRCLLYRRAMSNFLKVSYRRKSMHHASLALLLPLGISICIGNGYSNCLVDDSISVPSPTAALILSTSAVSTAEKTLGDMIIEKLK